MHNLVFECWQVGSRAVILLSGCIMVLMGMLGKIGAIFTTIPTPVVGGMFLIMFGVITAAGISNLQVKKKKKRLVQFVSFKTAFFVKRDIFVDPVHRHEFFPEYLCVWFLHVFGTRHSKLDCEESWVFKNGYDLHMTNKNHHLFNVTRSTTVFHLKLRRTKISDLWCHVWHFNSFVLCDWLRCWRGGPSVACVADHPYVHRRVSWVLLGQHNSW